MNVVFDFGGVLFDWQPRALLARLLPERADTQDRLLALESELFQGYTGDWGEFDRGMLEPDELARRIAVRCELSEARARAVIDAVPHELRLRKDTQRLLHALRSNGHALHYLSNMPAPYADHLESAFDVFELFRSGVFSSRVGLIKPEPAIFAHAVSAFGIDPGDTVFVDDNRANVAAAEDAGWRAIQFLDAAQCRASLTQFGLI